IPRKPKHTSRAEVHCFSMPSPCIDKRTVPCATGVLSRLGHCGFVVGFYPQLAAARRLTSLMRSLDCDTVLEMVARTVFSSAAALSHFACASLYAAADSPSHVAAMGAMTPLRSSSRPLMREDVELMSAAALEMAPNWYLISLMIVFLRVLIYRGVRDIESCWLCSVCFTSKFYSASPPPTLLKASWFWASTLSKLRALARIFSLIEVKASCSCCAEES